MTELTKAAPTLESLRARRDEIIQAAERYGVYNIRVFGSVARGEATPGSDVDLLVSAREGVSMFDLVGLWLDLQELLGYEVSLITDDEQAGGERLMQRARRDALQI
jgi:hypothetical protein